MIWPDLVTNSSFRDPCGVHVQRDMSPNKDGHFVDKIYEAAGMNEENG